jgi:glycosyltransferase involved in cell wall biosynthesis
MQTPPTAEPASSVSPEANPAAWPAVSVIMPVLNEEDHLREAVAGILEQEYPGTLDVVLALGPSRDRTGEIAAEICRENAHVRAVDNPTGRTPSGLNAAIRATRHPVVVRVDGHGRLPAGYIKAAVRLMQETGADNVGGMMVPEGRTPFEQAVARAMSSRLGIGGGRFHVGGDAGPAQTVYLGVFRREVLERLGGFDETFVRAQDWELNHRIRASGGLIWFSPDMRVAYRPRSSWKALTTQFFRTGQWRSEVMRRYPSTVSLRFLAPPTAVVAIKLGLLAGVAGVGTGTALLTLGWLLPALYASAVLLASPVVARGLPIIAQVWFPIVVATMHMSWGAGFLLGPRRRGP